MRSQFVTSRGSAIAIHEAGSGLPVLALHGLGGGAYFFRGLAARLEARCRVLAIDLPGTGHSTSGPTPFSLESWVADIGELIGAAIGAPAVILGHSLGTILALKGWEAWPQHIRALVFSGGLPHVRPAIRPRLTQRAEQIAREGMAGWGERVSPAVFSRATLRDRPELVAMFEQLFESQNPAAYVRCTEILLDASAASAVPTIQVPCSAVTGAEDQYAPPETVQAFVRTLPVACRQAVIPECGHMPFFEAPDAYATLLGSFLDTL